MMLNRRTETLRAVRLDCQAASERRPFQKTRTSLFLQSFKDHINFLLRDSTTQPDFSLRLTLKSLRGYAKNRTDVRTEYEAVGPNLREGSMIDFQTSPEKYRHWKLKIEGSV